jgi:transcriptional regulatory protein RtcR
MATLAAGGRIGVDHVDEECARLRAAWARGAAERLGNAQAGAGQAAGRAAGAPGGAGEARTQGAERALDEEAALVAEVLGAERAAALDRFDRAQLAEVLRVCREARSLSEAGRALFAASRARRTTVNDADRLRKYLARFGLGWTEVGGA